MDNFLLNSDSNLSGVYRVVIIYKVGDIMSHIFVPGRVVNPLNADGTLNEDVYQENISVYPEAVWNSPPMRDLIPRDIVLPGWVIYECGDEKRPIIMGYLGRALDTADEWAIEIQYNYVYGSGFDDGSSGGGGYIDETGSYVEGGGGTGNSIVDAASKYIGTKYVWGGDSASDGGLDCSGFVYNALKDAGKNVTRESAAGYYSGGKPVSRNNLQPGDIIFFGNGDSISHTGIYIGNGKFLHSSGGKNNTKENKGKGVVEASLDSYPQRYRGARRY